MVETTTFKEKYQQAFQLHQENKLDEAEKYYLEALNINDNNCDINNLLGLLYFTKKEYLLAETYIKKALSLKKDSYFINNLAQIYLETKNYDKAINVLEQGLKEDFENYELWFNLGLAYKNKNEWQKAKNAYKRVLEIKPDLQQVYFNLAGIALSEDNPYEMIDYYKKVLELNPNDLEAKYFLSLGYMKLKDYKTGLKYYENRLCRFSSILSQEQMYPDLANDLTLWNGQDISDKILFTYFEAGFGDVIMFARYFSILKEKCKQIIFRPQTELASLFKENYPNFDVVDRFRPQNEMHFDFHLPMLSLPYVLNLNNDEVFVEHQGYLKANREKVKKYKEKYFNNDKFKIGIKWQGNTYYDTDRVITIESFLKLIGIKNTQFYSCQTYEGAEELNKIKDKYEVIDLSSTFKDFSDTAAAVENFDLVICNDTSLAHLAGAMGKPCWILLPYVYNWRWHMDLNKCDWYDSVKLFRQSEPNNWDEVFDKIKIELKNIL